MKLKTPLFSGLSGSVAQAFQGVSPTCRTRRDGVIILQKKPIPPYGRTPAQDAQRVSFSDAVDAWNSLTPEQKEYWNALALDYYMTGYNYYLKKHMGSQINTYGTSKDSYVNQYFPDNNYGDDNNMNICNLASSFCRMYMKFDYSDIPVSSVIAKAILSLYYSAEAGAPDAARVLSLYRVNYDWDEMTITWNEQPGIAYVIYAETTLGTEGRWRQFDITNLVQEHVNGTYPNHGYMIRFKVEPHSPEQESLFSTKEATGHKPKLQVTYS